METNMELDTFNKNLVQLFGNHSNKMIYEIPKYQREYTWTRKEWEQLFSDVTTNYDGYFLGTIIAIAKGKNGDLDEFSPYEIIDGQQRFTTLSLFLLALYKHMLPFKDKILERFISSNDADDPEYVALSLLITEFTYKKKPRLTLQVQSNNSDDFKRLLKENNLLTDSTIPANDKNFKNRRIYKAFDFFYKEIKKYISEELSINTDSTELNEIIKLMSKFNSIRLVLITVKSASDAYTLFESLNNRGVPLSAIDLIKNSLMSRCEADSENEDVYDKWLAILNWLTDNHTIQERFFRQYYNAFVNELLDEEKGITEVKAQRGNLIKVYESLIKADHNKLLTDLYNKAQVYSILINNNDAVDSNLREALLNLERIEGSSSYILLLNIFVNRSIYSLSDKQLIEIINFLTKFFVHRNFTNTPPTSKSIIIFMDLINQIKDKKGKDVFLTIKTRLIKELGKDADKEFENCIKSQIYLNNKDSTRFILCYYEERQKTEECPQAVRDLWSRDEKGQYIYTIEHIFPEGKKIPDCWIEMIADGDKEKAYDYYDLYVHTLGNLTMTGYNSTLSNKSFIEKRDHSKNNKPVGYKNGLKLNEDLKDEEKWTVDKIQTRTDKLVKWFIEEFKF